eukprot:1138174-Pelagomonas_calceolata.AAC.1
MEIPHHSHTTGSHTHSRIDDIMLPSCILKINNINHQCSQLFCYTTDKVYKHSDHIPLVAHTPTNILGVKIRKPQQTAPAHQIERILVRPIKPSDIEKLHCAVIDPTYTPYISHANILGTVKSVHMTALNHLSATENTCAKKQARLTHISGLPAREVMEDTNDCHELSTSSKNAMRWLCRCAPPKKN